MKTIFNQRGLKGKSSFRTKLPKKTKLNSLAYKRSFQRINQKVFSSYLNSE